jgi:putative SOS response-associated peptidase YedK
MPVIIQPELYHKWLDRNTNADQAFTLLNNQAYLPMTATPVGDWVNNPRHDDERCVQAVKQ